MNCAIVSTAAWACIEFLPSHECAEAFGGLIWVSTAAWACIEFLPAQEWLNNDLQATTALSQQPLGLALSFYKQNDAFKRMLDVKSHNSRLGLH